MRQFIFLSVLFFIPFLMVAQPTKYGSGAGNGNGGSITSSYFGERAGYSITTTSHLYNTFVGRRAGYLTNNGGRTNSFFGASAGHDNTSGDGNTFIGQASGRYNTTGSYNTALGYRAGNRNKTGSGNVFIGRDAGYWETGSNKLWIDNCSGCAALIYGDFTDDYVVIAGGRNVVPATNPDAYGLYVTKGILTEKVKVAGVNSGNWSDYVFEEEYDLNSTKEVETFIKENKHLPNVPSAKEVSENGVDMVEMDATLLRQIEELWLHVIELKKENENVKAENEILKTRVNALEDK